MDEVEVPLAGGNVSAVVRVGDTVRRNTGPWTPAIHALLRYLEEMGFEGAPRVLGIDAQGREMLSYLKGRVELYPMPAYVGSERSLEATARLLRRYHDVVSGFTAPPRAVWRMMPGAPTDGSVICHNDIAPHNIVFAAEEPVAFIDWDLASPGPPLWDIAHALWYFTLMDGDSGRTPVERGRRMRLFCDAYGLEDRSELIPTIRRRQEVLYLTLKTWAEEGDPAFALMWNTGHANGPLNDMAFIDAHRADLEIGLEG